MRWLLAAGASWLVVTTVMLGTFVPLQDPAGVQYLFAAPSLRAFLIAAVAGVWALALAYASVRARARAGRSTTCAAEAHSGRWLAPIALLGVLGLGVLPAVPGVGERGAVAGYFLYDLRWWWTLLAAAWTIARADRLVGAPIGGLVRRVHAWSTPARLLLFDAALFLGVIAWAVATTSMRFDNTLNGDEPKYVRYCEAWYQGQGMDISSLRLVRDEPIDAPPRLWQNVRRLAKAVPDDAAALIDDLRAFVRTPATFRWNRARSDDGFVTGIHGGLYQIHDAGVCAVLFPGYAADRYLLNVDTSPDGKWPAHLAMTNVMMLLTYGICAVLLFRLLRRALGSDALGWIWAAAAMLMLPTAAFAFQLYPELPASMVILAVSGELLFGGRSRTRGALAAGAATGALAWLHVRFLLVCACFAVVAWLTKAGRARWAFLGGCGMVVLGAMAFEYHVTGSWSPIARMQADGQGLALNGIGVVLNAVGYGLDRRLGLLPHAVILIGVLPGLAVLARESRAATAFVAVIVGALVAPAAAYSLSPAGTTPDRFVAAVVPLLIWPVAILVRRFWASYAVRIVTVILGVVTLDSARVYDEHHDKAFGAMRDASVSGWKPNLAFPVIRGEGWDSSMNLLLFGALALGLLALTCLAFVRAGRSDRRRPGVRPSWLALGAVVLAVLGGFSAATLANGDFTYYFYLLNDASARASAIRAVMDVDRCVCFSSTRGRVDWTNVVPDTAQGAVVGVYPAERDVTVHVLVQGDATGPAFGRMLVEFGDGARTGWEGVLEERRLVHRYARPGTYPVHVWFRLPARVAPQLDTQTVTIGSGR